MKIKLLIVNSTLEVSGLTNVIYNICSKINYEKFDVILITLSPEPPNSKLSDFLKLPIKHYCLNQNRLSSFLFAKKKLKQLVILIKPDIINTQSYISSVLVNNSFSNITKISTLHGILENNYVINYGNFLGKIIAQVRVFIFFIFEWCGKNLLIHTINITAFHENPIGHFQVITFFFCG
jgi:hypothetical protein